MKFEKEVILDNIHTFWNEDAEPTSTGISLDYVLNNEEKEILDYLKGNKVKITIEGVKPIISSREREYLQNVINPFRDKVIGIYKYNSVLSDYEETAIVTLEDYNCSHMTHLPPFERVTMYKGMEVNKEYSLEELGL